ncbi:MAG: Ig-like domain-containing protein [Candidatus Pacebacteria bacterium]|nr:Ig-like domain-containing protein [Candidatus Paceibacterota bacterium]
MKQKIKSLISLKATSAMFGLLFFVALAGGMVINAPSASAATPVISGLTVTPNSGTVKVGNTVVLTITADTAGYIASAIAVNGVDVAASNFQDLTGGLYSVDYIVAEGNSDVSSGAITASVVLTDGANPNTAYTAVTANTLVVDANSPTITSIISDATGAGVFKITDTILFTLTPGATEAGASVAGSYNGVSLTWSTANSGVTYTATYTVASGNADQTSALQISGVVITDAAGNVSGPGSGSDVVKTIDANVPTAIVVATIATIYDGSLTQTITVTYNEAMTASDPTITITGLTSSYIVTGGSWSTVTNPSDTYIVTQVIADDGEAATATINVSLATDVAGNVQTANNTETFAVDTLNPINQDTVFASSTSQTGGGSVTIVSSGAGTNNVWFASSGTITFSVGATMTTAGGTATTILAPATAGSYKLFVIDAAGNASAESSATLTVDNTFPTATFSPTSGATGVAVDTTIILTFSEAMRLVAGNAAITNSNVAGLITLKKTNSSGANVSFTATVNTGKTVITITPSANLSNGQLHYVAIGTTIEDTADNALVATTATFTTVNVGSSGTVSPIPTSTTGQAAATPANGGIISKTNSDGTSAKIVLPVDALIANAVITINPIVKAEVVASMSLPNEKNIIGDYAYKFTAVNALNNAVNNFEKALVLTFTYTDEQVEGMNEEALRVHYWNEALSQWVMLENGEVNIASNIVTATTTHFTYFAVFEGEGGIISPSEIIDGDIIQCQSSDNPFAVYIVKIVGDTKYIRHIVSLEIFDYYAHLKWENLKQVDSLDAYSLSGWARVNTGEEGTAGPNDKVYEINGDQSKHWINMTAEDFLSHGGSEPAIYSINQGELDLYTTGVDVMSL